MGKNTFFIHSYCGRFLVWAGLLLVLAGIVCLVLPDDDGPAVPPVRRIVHYRFSLANQTNRSVSEATFFTFAPLASSPFQSCSKLTTSQPFSYETDSNGNRFLRFDLKNIAPFARQEIKVTVQMDMFSGARRESFAPQKTDFLSPSQNIESNAPQLLKQALLLASKGKSDPARDIFDWVAGHVRYAGASGKDKGALHALRSGAGDCTDMALLFTALCRAAGIPCRTVGGFICDRNMNLTASSYHNWAEFFAAGQWWIADVTNASFKPDGANYVVFHLYGDGAEEKFQRFRVAGEGLRARMK
ncbi:MAG: transglutaminase domain-containing protein [Deltaproteobacteria bacterium]|nr:transglutaminase domain-containing protein [Deltaproteobacteria bacterium]